MFQSLINRMLILIRRPIFIVLLNDGVARCPHGKTKGAFLQDCSDIAQKAKLKKGQILCVKKGGKATLSFSRNIPNSLHQRFRNAWVVNK